MSTTEKVCEQLYNDISELNLAQRGLRDVQDDEISQIGEATSKNLQLGLSEAKREATAHDRSIRRERRPEEGKRQQRGKVKRHITHSFPRSTMCMRGVFPLESETLGLAPAFISAVVVSLVQTRKRNQKAAEHKQDGFIPLRPACEGEFGELPDNMQKYK